MRELPPHGSPGEAAGETISAGTEENLVIVAWIWRWETDLTGGMCVSTCETLSTLETESRHLKCRDGEEQTNIKDWQTNECGCNDKIMNRK